MGGSLSGLFMVWSLATGSGSHKLRIIKRACWFLQSDPAGVVPVLYFSMRKMIVVVLALVLTACSESDPTGPTVGERFVQVSVSPGHHSCAVTSAGRVLCWGDDSFGQLGDGEARCDSTACAGEIVEADLPDIAVHVAAGLHSTCAVTDGGELYCWGRAIEQLWSSSEFCTRVEVGMSSRDSSRVRCSTAPVAVPLGESIVDVDLGDLHGDGCAVTSRPSTVCWGVMQSELAVIDSVVPLVEVHVGDDFACGLTETRDLWCFGENDLGQLGLDLWPDSSDTLGMVVGGVDRVVVGAKTTCAWTDDETLCWGRALDGIVEFSGRFLDRTFVDVPSSVADGEDLEFIAFGTDGYSCSSDGALIECGVANDRPALPFGATLTSLSVGDGYGCGVTSGGSVVCWGNDERGETGPPGSGSPRVFNPI